MHYLIYVLLSIVSLIAARGLPRLGYKGEIDTVYAFLIHVAGYETVDVKRGFRFRPRDSESRAFVKGDVVHKSINKILSNCTVLAYLLCALCLALAARGLL